MTDFGNLKYYWLFIVIPAMALIFILLLFWKRKALSRFADKEIVNQLMPGRSVFMQVLRFGVFTAGIILLIIGIMNPRIGSKLIEKKKEGIDIMIALDISNSMKAEDIAPNRLTCAKQAIINLSKKLEGDRLGIIVFAGSAFVQLPMTADHGAAELFSESIDCDLISSQGTDIGAALRLASKSFGEGSIGSKVIILLTDGENHEEDAMNAAQEAASKGIVVHCIGMATPKGAPVPATDDYGNIVFKKDGNGNVVISKLDEELLKKIAAAGSGTYTRASNSESGLSKILSRIRDMDQKESVAKVYSEYINRFQLFLGIALILLVLEMILPDTINPVFKKLFAWRKK